MMPQPKSPYLLKKKPVKNGPRLHPGLKTALIYLIPSVILRILTAVIGFAWLGGLLQLILYFFCGYSAGKAYYETIRRLYPKGKPTEQMRNGAASGMALGILLTVVTLLLMLVAGPVMLSLPFLAGGIVLVCWIPYDVLAGLFLGAFGGRISARR